MKNTQQPPRPEMDFSCDWRKCSKPMKYRSHHSKKYQSQATSGAASSIIGVGGRIFISSCFALLISFEIDCFYGVWTQIYEYPPPPSPIIELAAPLHATCISHSQSENSKKLIKNCAYFSLFSMLFSTKKIDWQFDCRATVVVQSIITITIIVLTWQHWPRTPERG